LERDLVGLGLFEEVPHRHVGLGGFLHQDHEPVAEEVDLYHDRT